ncbi:MAG TPA: hypothetical protein VIF57_27550 [Polyangia bacterium]|jgi:hypothetical protein
MNKVLRVSLFSIAALLPLPAGAQVLCTLGPATPPYEPMADMPASAGAQAELKKVKALLCPKGCGKVVLYANATTPNTATISDGAGGSKIAYSPTFAGSVQKSYGPIAMFGIVAHNFGHHMDASVNRPAWMKESWDGELRADAWAGCAIAKAEMTPSRLQAVLLAMSTYPSAHHPPWSERRPVITEGYTHCGGKVLPPLARESSEQAGRSEDRSGAKSEGKSGGRKDEALSAAPGPGGCTSDRDCRNGRVCVSSRCGAAPARRRCGKDTDCPEPQECGSANVCVGPAGQAAQARATQSQPEPEPAKPAGPMLAALQEARTAGAAAPTATAGEVKDVAACQRSCEEVRNQCVEAITGEANKCLAAIRAEPGYRSCACPNYPAGNTGCYNFCANAYEKGKSCAGEPLIHDCKVDGERCRAQCK